MAEQQVPTDPKSTRRPRIIPRSAEILQELPTNYRWEFTRRHPYYLLFWEAARRHAQHPSDNPLEQRLGEAATLMLRVIGVTADPLPPGTNCEDLEQPAMATAWRDGAIAPLTFRSIVGAMLACLPPESRLAIGEFLVQSAATDSREPSHSYQLLSDFMGRSDPALDMLLAGPIVSINLRAPLRAIVTAIEDMVREQKSQQGICEVRRRDDKLPAYLEVWDRREGWCGDHYDLRRSQSFRKIAEEFSESMSTVANRYRSAFRYLIGQDYCPEVWMWTLGAFKICEEIKSGAIPRALTRRRWMSSERLEEPKTREVPESVISSGQSASNGHRGSFLENTVEVEDMTKAADLLMDIESLVARGDYDDAQIAKAVEKELADVSDLIQLIRSRRQDGI